MAGIMADHDCHGQFAVLVGLLESAPYSRDWKLMELEVVDFVKLGLPVTASDATVWQACQQHQIVLITSNRNAESPDSLEETIRAHNDVSCLPVITIADPRRLMKSKSYAVRAVERLLDYLRDLENYRGAGRLYIP